MSTINADNMQQMANQFATYDVQGRLDQLDRKEAAYKEQRDALTSLRSALTTFTSSLSKLDSANSGMLVNSAQFSAEGYASATVDKSAAAGRYQFYVEELASTQQMALQGFPALLENGGSGASFTISQGQDQELAVNLAGVETLADLAAKINEEAESGGFSVRASVVRNNGDDVLLLTAEESGEANGFNVTADFISSDGTTGTGAVSVQTLSEARDAVVRLGGSDGIALTSSTNTFSDIIDGVSLTFDKTHAEGELPLTIDIGRDDSATKENVQSFVDAYNKLMTEFDKLTASGGENSARGSLAGDASVRSIESQLNNLIRTKFGDDKGMSLIDFGIAADRNGKLTIDNDRFEAAVAEQPEALEQLFTGTGNLLDTMEDTLRTYTKSADGILKNRIDTLDSNLRRLDDQFDGIQRQYDMYYNRYLRQFSNMLEMMEAMQSTQSMFL